MEKLKYFFLLIQLALSPMIASAQSDLLPERPSGLPGNQNMRADELILDIIEILLFVVGIIAVLFLIWGGLRYITSAGSEEASESAKKTIQNSIIGLIIVVLSYVIVTVIINTLIRGY